MNTTNQIRRSHLFVTITVALWLAAVLTVTLIWVSRMVLQARHAKLLPPIPTEVKPPDMGQGFATKRITGKVELVEAAHRFTRERETHYYLVADDGKCVQVPLGTWVNFQVPGWYETLNDLWVNK